MKDDKNKICKDRFQFLVTFDIMLKYRPDNAKLHIQSLIQVIQVEGGE